MSYQDVRKWQELLSKHGVTVYPIMYKGYALIEVNYQGKIKRFDKKITHNQLNKWDKNNPIYKTLEYYYNILSKKND